MKKLGSNLSKAQVDHYLLDDADYTAAPIDGDRVIAGIPRHKITTRSINHQLFDGGLIAAVKHSHNHLPG